MQPKIVEVKGDVKVKLDKDIGLDTLPTKEMCIRIRLPTQYLDSEKTWDNLVKNKDQI